MVSFFAQGLLEVRVFVRKPMTRREGRFSLRIVKKSDLCLISAQILSRLSLLARESQSILQRQIETCALQPTDFKVRFVK